ncbi:hypothetical protein DV515_00019087 [Chloebia gouldiae]|uniref:Uncharacterized protein n=1 Tax=Chloebia gouldiae TaxID=44316 RepID=A0A3L8Q5Z8_CHLGU|nr:hypothetical protein DV515_00019087 [Chloebia gouldiae]
MGANPSVGSVPAGWSSSSSKECPEGAELGNPGTFQVPHKGTSHVVLCFPALTPLWTLQM